MKQLDAKAVVLARIDYGEADRIITFLTPNQGKVRVLAKGVRKHNSKLAGGIELFSISDISYVLGKKDLHTLISSRLITHYGNIVKDIDKTMFGYEMLRILNKVLEDEGGEDYFNLLSESLIALNTPTLPKELVECSFLLRIMQLLGHLPNFISSVNGGKLSTQGNFNFSFEDMAFFEISSGQYDKNHIKLLRLISHNSPKEIIKIAGLKKYLNELSPLVRQMSKQYVVTF